MGALTTKNIYLHYSEIVGDILAATSKFQVPVVVVTVDTIYNQCKLSSYLNF